MVELLSTFLTDIAHFVACATSSSKLLHLSIVWLTFVDVDVDVDAILISFAFGISPLMVVELIRTNGSSDLWLFK